MCSLCGGTFKGIVSVPTGPSMCLSVLGLVKESDPITNFQFTDRVPPEERTQDSKKQFMCVLPVLFLRKIRPRV